MCDPSVEFVLYRTAVALFVFINEPKPLRSDAGEVNRFDLRGQTVHGSCLRQNEFDRLDIDAEGDWTQRLAPRGRGRSEWGARDREARCYTDPAAASAFKPGGTGAERALPRSQMSSI